MTGRASVFSDPAVIDLMNSSFVPVVENSSGLERQPDDKGVFFRHVAEQGHYAGRTFPTATRQGSYAFRADGTFLGSINSLDPQAMLGMMRVALGRDADRTLDAPPSPVRLASVSTAPDLFPSDGLVLESTVRDLPRNDGGTPDDGKWNLDYVWIRREEAQALVPEPREVGSRRAVPWTVGRRLARFHLRDAVRGEPFNWPDAAIRRAELSTEIVGVDGDEVRLALRGEVRLQHEVTWVEPKTSETIRVDAGYEALLRGDAAWNEAWGRFTAFTMVATGPRWGATQYNFRMNDPGPAPMGIAFVLAGTTPADRTPPHCLRTWQMPDDRTFPASRVAVEPAEYFAAVERTR